MDANLYWMEWLMAFYFRIKSLYRFAIVLELATDLRISVFALALIGLRFFQSSLAVNSYKSIQSIYES